MAKDLLYGIDARNALIAGVDKLADTVKITLEWKAAPSTATTWVNTLIYAFLLVLTILFLIFMHTPAKPVKRPQKK